MSCPTTTKDSWLLEVIFGVEMSFICEENLIPEAVQWLIEVLFTKFDTLLPVGSLICVYTLLYTCGRLLVSIRYTANSLA